MSASTVLSAPGLCVCGGSGVVRLVRTDRHVMPAWLRVRVGCPHCRGVDGCDGVLPVRHVRWMTERRKTA